MIQHAWTVLCTKCIVDPESRNATLVEVLDQLNVPTPPGFPIIVPIQMDLVTAWFRGNPDVPERGTGRISLLMPDGSSTAAQEYVIDMTEFPRSRTITRSGGIIINGAGTYSFRVEVRDDGTADWRLAASLPLSVVLIEIAQPQHSAPAAEARPSSAQA
jgi:hypothetical protein